MILVIGASGLVGSHLVNELAKTNTKIIATYHSHKPSTNNNPNINWQKLDILDVIDVEDVLKNVTQVYHCAAIVSFNPKDKELLHKINIEGTKNIVNACINNNIEKLVYVSSVATLDRFKNGELVDERFADNNKLESSVYAKTKSAAENEVWRGIGEGLNAIIINPSIILGAGDWHNGSTAIFKNCYNEFPWYTNGSNGFVDVVDVAKAMILLMKSSINNERFIINAINTSYQDLFNKIAKVFNKKPPTKLATPFLATIAWRVEKIKSFFTNKKPLLTKETSYSAQQKIAYNNQKFLNQNFDFIYNNIDNSIERICNELKIKYNLS